jgi:hypothetical protein
MKFFATTAVLFLLFPADIYAARCKVNGEWYAYDSPECNPQQIDDSEESAWVPIDPEPTSQDKPSTPAYAQPKIIPAYQRPWPEVSYEVEERCKNAKPPPLAVFKCRSREEAGYWAMKSNFGLPEDVALEAKAICIAKTETFHSQSSCMEYESLGYRLFTLDYAMPANYLNVAKTKCLQQHRSYSDRGNCMMGEESDFDKKYGHQFYKPRRTGRGTTTPKKPYVATVASTGKGPPRVSALARFSTSPAQRPSAEIGTNRSVPPYPMQIRERALHLGIDSSDFSTSSAFEAEMEEKTVHFVLTSKEPMIENKGFIELISPETMDPKRGALISPKTNGQVILHLSVEGGRIYLIDFVINSWEKGSYKLTAESGEQVYEDINGNYNHVIAQLAAVSLGWTQVELKQDLGAGFYLHAVAVTSIEQALLPVKSSVNQ